MTLETHFNEVMEVLLSDYPRPLALVGQTSAKNPTPTSPHPPFGHLLPMPGAKEKMKDVLCENTITAKQLIHSIDLTLLDEYATTASLSQLKHLANQQEVAAICVYTQYLEQFSSQNDINLATVINFPQGTEELDVSFSSIENAIQLGVTEIDYVLPYRMYLQGQKQNALNHCAAISQLCKNNKLVLKIILETGAFPDIQTVYTASKELLELGCDFLKTSTGKISLGASLSAVFAILSAIKDTSARCGIKISGGVKKPQQAYNYAMLAELMIGKQINKNWFRIGASSLLEELLKIN